MLPNVWQLQEVGDFGACLPSGRHKTVNLFQDETFNLSQFEYNPQKDHYTCPEGNLLTTNGRWYRKDQGKNTIQVKHYKTLACKTCPMLDLCTKNTKGRGRVIERSEYAPYLERNRRNIEEKEKLYRRRQAIVEHPFGTMKRQWGYNYILTKRGIKRASSSPPTTCAESSISLTSTASSDQESNGPLFFTEI